jgi:MYXO-CTERM domain-containing protein
MRAFDINDSEAIVGIYFPEPARRRAYVLHGTEVRELPPLLGDLESYAGAINDDECIVGMSIDSLGASTAIVYLNGSATPTDLNTLVDPIPGVYLERAIDINDAGQILVEGYGTGGEHYYVLTPTPEPVAGAMLLGLAGIGLLRRRRRAQCTPVPVGRRCNADACEPSSSYMSAKSPSIVCGT